MQQLRCVVYYYTHTKKKDPPVFKNQTHKDRHKKSVTNTTQHWFGSPFFSILGLRRREYLLGVCWVFCWAVGCVGRLGVALDMVYLYIHTLLLLLLHTEKKKGSSCVQKSNTQRSTQKISYQHTPNIVLWLSIFFYFGSLKQLLLGVLGVGCWVWH
jgi:hypothetical protein